MRTRTCPPDPRRSQRGMAAVEMALVLPLLASLLFFLVEGAGAFRASLVLSEASREAARLVLRTGDAAGAASLVASLTGRLSGTVPATSVSVDNTAHTVTVHVEYAYAPVISDNPLLAALPDGRLTLRSRTVMPLP
ncbi:MAG: TadE/TadG family type IV pilus assembly protein [Thermodesulfobacteriota bacterium]